MKNKEIKRLIGIVVFVIFFGIMVMAFHSLNSQTFSQGVEGLITGSSLDIQKIKEEMDTMDQEEIEKTIREIEKEIDRLKSDIR